MDKFQPLYMTYIYLFIYCLWWILFYEYIIIMPVYY